MSLELEADERLLVELFRSPEFDAEGRQGDHDGLRPCQTAVRVLKEMKRQRDRLRHQLAESEAGVVVLRIALDNSHSRLNYLQATHCTSDDADEWLGETT